MFRAFVSIAVFAAVSAAGASAFAADTWTDPAPGVRQLVRTAAGPLRYVALTVDLSRGEYYVRATRPEERGQTVTGWATNVGAVAAINGDFFEGGYQPVGLAVGDGVHWDGTTDQGWSFMACTLENDCVFDDWPTDQQRHHLWHEVVGGNGWRLLIDGNVPDYPADGFYTARHPRSGVGVSEDGKTMILAVVEGRRPDSIGLGFRDFALFLKELGAYQALMLDGGGSSALVVNGARVSQLPSAQGSERIVANHIGILRGTPDARCDGTPNGRYCEGTVIHTCRGGGYVGNGDCAAYGSACEVTTDGIGVCVHPFCTGGANGKFCEDETIITTCDYGVPGPSGDCAEYGATCETGEENSYCVHFLCTEGGNAAWCRDDAVLAECVDGQPLDDVDCSAEGKTCSEGACVEPDSSSDDDDPGHDASDDVEPGGESDLDDGSSEGDGERNPPSDTAADDDGPVVVEGEAGCRTTSPPGPTSVLLLLICLGLIVRTLLPDSRDE